MLVPSLTQLSCGSTVPVTNSSCCQCLGGSPSVDTIPGNPMAASPATSLAPCPFAVCCQHINTCHNCHTNSTSYFGTCPQVRVIDRDHYPITDKNTLKGPCKSSPNEALSRPPISEPSPGKEPNRDLHKSQPPPSRMGSYSQSCPDLCGLDMARDSASVDVDVVGQSARHPVTMTLSPPPPPPRADSRSLLSLDDLSVMTLPHSRGGGDLSPKSLTRDDSHLDLLRDDFDSTFYCSLSGRDRAQSDCDSSHVTSDQDCDNRSAGKSSPRFDVDDVSTDTLCAHRQCNCQDIRSGSSRVHKDIAVIPEVVPKFCTRFELEHWYRRTKSLYGASPNFKFGPKASVMKSQAAVLTIQDPGSQRLTWYKPPLSVLIIRKMPEDDVIPQFVELVTWLVEQKQMVVFLEKKSLDEPLLNDYVKFMNKIHPKLMTFKESEDDLTDKIDFIICLGGDGTLLYASSLFQQSVPPVMAFNLGSMGFLTPFSFQGFQEQVTQVLEGNAALTLRTRLKCQLCRSTDLECPPIKNVESKKHILVLNEVVVDRGPSPYLSNVDLYIEHRYITSVQGDGLIISTPTGSTAYSAAAGASMIHPNVPAILITPICPHSLSFRPIVVPAGVEIKIMVSPEARASAWVSFDGRNRQEIQKNDALRISTSIYPVPSLCSEDQISDWFDSLTGALHWNVRKQQKGFRHVPSSESFPDLEVKSNRS